MKKQYLVKLTYLIQDHLLSLPLNMSKTLHTHTKYCFTKMFHNLLHKSMILKTMTEETLGMRLRLLNHQQGKLLHYAAIFLCFLLFWITEKSHGN